jgi:prepilin-type N-terminal cleavage/methylation domain-containing protein
MLKKGFTLVELIVVIVILGVLAALAFPRIVGSTEAARAQEAMQFFGVFRRAIEDCYITTADWDSCRTPDSVGVIVPPGASFGYSIMEDGVFTDHVCVTATRNSGPLIGAQIGMRLNLDGQGRVATVFFTTNPKPGPYDGIVDRTKRREIQNECF